MALFLPNQTVAERVVQDGFKQFERALKRFGISSPITPGVDILFDYGTALNPELVLSFYTQSGNLTPQAGDCYCQDKEKVDDAWQAFKTFIRMGGHRITAERRSDAYSANRSTVIFEDQSAINIINDRASGLPMLSVVIWRNGILDLTDLKQTTDMGFYVGERLERIGYRRYKDRILMDMGQIFRHPDPDMVPVLMDWNTPEKANMILFPADQQPIRINLTNSVLESLNTPVLDMRRRPIQLNLYEYKAIPVNNPIACIDEQLVVD